MKTLKILLAAVMACCMVFTLCACGQDTAGNDDTAPDGTTTNPSSSVSKPADDGKVTYTVRVVDENGNGITGGMIQFCLDSCMPCILDENGVASMALPEADYKVSFTMMPAGYALTGEETEFYFAGGSYELTIILKAAG